MELQDSISPYRVSLCQGKWSKINLSQPDWEHLERLSLKKNKQEKKKLRRGLSLDSYERDAVVLEGHSFSEQFANMP